MENQRISNRYIKLADLQQLLKTVFPDSICKIEVRPMIIFL